MKEPGRIVRLSGATVVAEDLGPVGMGELVLVGRERLPAEVIRLAEGKATLQVYEETEGLVVGEPVEATGSALTAELGPGLLGRIFDGVERPLAVLAKRSPFVERGTLFPPLDRARRFDFAPQVKAGEEIQPGQRLGTVQETAVFTHTILAPPEVGGRVRAVHPGNHAVEEPVVELEGGRTISMLQRWPLRRRRQVRKKLPPSVPFLTGQRVLDCLFPVAKGGTAVVPGGFGTGKTVLEQTLAKFAAADVIVYVGCGERGNEMTEVLEEFGRLTDPRSGAPLLDRTVMIVNTSNMPVAAREASIYLGMTIAEYFRDQALEVALMVDSTSRWAEALREISSRLEELPGEEGYPTYLASRLGQFYERAGRVEPLCGGEGAVTAVAAISPAGGDFSEPVTQASIRLAGALWGLNASLAHARHFPAVDWGQSFSLDFSALEGWFARELTPAWGVARDEALRLLQRDAELAEIVQLVGVESLEDQDRLVIETARLLREGFLRQNAFHEHDATCPPGKALAILQRVLAWRLAGAAAVERGVPLKALLSTGLDERLLRLCELPSGEIPAACDALQADVSRVFAELPTA